jgi:hypothetical protein
MNVTVKYSFAGRLLFSLFALSDFAFAQNVRYDAPANQTPGATVQVCASPANGIPCSNFVTTYDFAGNACPNNAQDTPQPNGACQATLDGQGKVGFWIPAGTYAYTTCVPGNNCSTPVTFSLGGAGNGSGVVSPGTAVQQAIYAANGSTVSGQNKSTTYVLDYGVVGDGCVNIAHDETAAFQAAMNAAIGTPFAGVSGKLVMPEGSCINVSSTISVYGAKGLVVECQGAQGQSVNDCGINWIGSAGGTVLAINQTRDSLFSGFFVSTGQAGGSTSANVAIDVDETGTIHGITSHDSFKDMMIFQYPTTNPSFVGVRFGNSAPGNIEAMDLENVSVACRGTPVGLSSTGTAFQVGKTGGGAEPFYVAFHGNQEVVNCSIGWDLQSNNKLVTIDGGLTSKNYYTIYAEAGSLASASHVRDEGSTFFLGMLSNFNDFHLDHISLSGLTSGGTSIDLSNAGSGTNLTVENSTWDTMASFTPISPNTGGGSTTILDHNLYPNSGCALNGSFGGKVRDLFSAWGSGNCPNVLGPGITFNNQIISTLATGTAPFLVSSTTPVVNLTASNHPQVYEAGVVTTGEKIYTNTQALTAGTATHTLANSFTFTSSGTFGCTCTDQTAANACRAVPASATTVTLAGTGTDTLWLSCSGH